MSNIGLYIHVPFCRRKCAYCDFYSLSGCEDIIPDHVNAVIRNIKAQGRRYDTVYFGGGTPSLLSGAQIYDILNAADIANGAEISAECNPDSADAGKLSELRAAGINRLSVGIQSFDDRELAALGRLHSASQAENAIKNARKAGFENISADLMLGIPYQSIGSLRRNIRLLSELEATHVSAYMLKIEENTPLAADRELISAAADGDEAADFYLEAVSLLEKAGFYQYEISNFSRKGFECRHNLKYWRCEDYIGIGPSAHSCADGKRSFVPNDLTDFIGRDVQKTVVTDDMPCTASEKIMLALRLTEGLELSDTGENADRILRAAMPLAEHGFLTLNGGRLALTVKGFLVSNEIICRLTENII